MAKLSLKIVVAGRTYPLSVNENEEANVLKAAEDINKAIKLLKENYAGFTSNDSITTGL